MQHSEFIFATSFAPSLKMPSMPRSSGTSSSMRGTPFQPAVPGQIDPNAEILKIKAKQFFVHSTEVGLCAALCVITMCMLRPSKNRKFYNESDASDNNSESEKS